MSDWIITAECNACQQMVPISELVQHDDRDDCPRCGNPFFWEPDNMVLKPCGVCSTPVRWPADDDYDVLCHPCIRRLVAAS